MNAQDWHTVWFTVWVAAAAVCASLPAGVALAWLLARTSWRGKSLVETLVALPLVLPPVATGLVLLVLFGRRGPFGGLDVVFTWRAVVLALAVMSFPLLVRSLRTAFEAVPRRLEDVAHTLGAGRWHVFRTVTLPLARRGLLAGVVLAFARSLGEFGATIVLAGYLPGETGTLSLEIYHAIQVGEDSRALGLIAVCTVLAFALLLASEWLSRPRHAP